MSPSNEQVSWWAYNNATRAHNRCALIVQLVRCSDNHAIDHALLPFYGIIQTYLLLRSAVCGEPWIHLGRTITHWYCQTQKGNQSYCQAQKGNYSHYKVTRPIIDIAKPRKATIHITSSERQSFILPNSERQSFILPSSERQSFILPSSERQSFILTSSEGQLFILPNSERQLFILPKLRRTIIHIAKLRRGQSFILTSSEGELTIQIAKLRKGIKSNRKSFYCQPERIDRTIIHIVKLTSAINPRYCSAITHSLCGAEKDNQSFIFLSWEWQSTVHIA